MKNIPLETLGPSKLPTIANQLGEITHHSTLVSPEIVALHASPFGYVDRLAARSGNPEDDLRAIVLTDSTYRDIAGMLVARKVEKWSGRSTKQVRDRSQLDMVGVGYVLDQIGFSADEVLERKLSECFSGGLEVTELDLLVPLPPVNTRNKWNRIIGSGGLEEFPYFLIGESDSTGQQTDSFVSHSQTPPNKQVYCGMFHKINAA